LHVRVKGQADERVHLTAQVWSDRVDVLKRYGLDRFGLPGGRRTAPQSRQGLEPFVHGRRDQFVRGRPLEDRDDAMDIVVDRTSRPRLAWRIGVLVAHDHLLADQPQSIRAEVRRRC